eukprot:19458-Heterococcus_DN1.PRE.2
MNEISSTLQLSEHASARTHTQVCKICSATGSSCCSRNVGARNIVLGKNMRRGAHPTATAAHKLASIDENSCIEVLRNSTLMHDVLGLKGLDTTCTSQ